MTPPKYIREIELREKFLLETIKELSNRVTALEAERAVRAVLARADDGANDQPRPTLH